MEELAEAGGENEARTMAEWLRRTFGPTLTALFFEPFHERYTAGLYRKVAPQDRYKSPVSRARIYRGAEGGRTDGEGYNATFIYPSGGMDALVDAMGRSADIRLGKRVVEVGCANKTLVFADGSEARYERLISTIPLNEMMGYTRIDLPDDPDPYTSVLVLNIGGIRGRRRMREHWWYVPNSRAGFYRVGCYSSVSTDFLPVGARDRVSFYVEKSFCAPCGPSADEVEMYSREVVSELKTWGLISEVEAISPSWVSPAYTWRRPGSRWVERAVAALAERSIVSTGRYGRWRFQGIAQSIADGLAAGAAQ